MRTKYHREITAYLSKRGHIGEYRTLENINSGLPVAVLLMVSFTCTCAYNYPRHACAVRVVVLGLFICVSVCVPSTFQFFNSMFLYLCT